MNILTILAGVIYLYLIWRNLRDNYNHEGLVSYSWLSLLAFLIGGRLAFGIANWGVWNDNWWNWLSFWDKTGFNYIGAVVVWTIMTGGYCQKLGWKVWALFEDVVGIGYIFMTILILVEAINHKFDLYWLTLMMVLVVTMAAKRLIIGKYRSFGWYGSGKKGFAFFFANIWLGVLLAGWFYLVARAGIILSGLSLIISLTSIVGLFILGRNRR
jgi:hypothetical protein